MELLPTASATRPRLACEIRPDGVVAARSESAAAEPAAMARVRFPTGVLSPSLRGGNIGSAEDASRALRQALDEVAAKGGERSRYVTMVIPDAAVRVLLIDFDTLPAKASEALPVVRFRLKKLLPFDVEHALVSYQQMGGSAGNLAVLAVAIPREVLSEYEGLAARAGYTPGAVLPSTLAALAGLDGQGAALVVNIDEHTVTTAIVRGGTLLLHRMVEVDGSAAAEPSAPAAEVTEPTSRVAEDEGVISVWPAGDRPDYDRLEAAAAMDAEDLYGTAPAVLAEASERAVSILNQAAPVSRSREIAQAVSVAAAYYEDTLRMPAEEVLAAGSISAVELAELLREHGMGELRVRELVEESAVAAVSSSAGPGRGSLAGVRGALRG